ncbi:uncharacterized protein [Misgurnus anguillicaudatus]|uniref:uncharacterized protein n=1 Tax=Misgurnus anguillicaudatus TaxID=75329 RepID=UPI003CCF5DE8
MHAKAHSTKCEIIWSGKNQEGAGTTAGEEVEMVNSYLSRCALTTKYMTKSARNDMLTVHAIGWNRRKWESLHLALSSRYIKTFKKAEAESQKLEDLTSQLGCPENIVHQWVHDVRQWATDDSVGTRCDDQQSLQKSIEQMFLGVQQKKASLYNQTESSNILTKKKIFDVYMSKVRLQEEKIIVIREMRQHCTYLRKLAGNIKTMISEMSSGKSSGSLSEEGHRGLLCLLKKRHADVEQKFQVICSCYSQALGPNAASLLEDGPEEIPEDHEEVEYESLDDSDFEAV